MLMSAISAVRDVDPWRGTLQLPTRSDSGARLRYLIIPSMLPQFITGIRIASNTALDLLHHLRTLVGMERAG